jgi:cysteine desulfurase/selenocysteine lyase
MRPGYARIGAAPHAPPFTPEEAARVRRDFPILEFVREDGKPLVYLDNAATAQKPQAVLDATHRYYSTQNANVHRGVHYLSQVASDEYEAARGAVAAFLGAKSPCEIVFTRGATEGINLVAQTFGRRVVGRGDEVLVSVMEHHSNLVPWQRLCEEQGAILRAIPITDAGELRLDEFSRLLSERTKLVALTHVSNVLGTVNAVKTITDMAHAYEAAVLLDGAQSVPHLPVNVAALGCDFFVCSGHKMFGPTGIGVLYGRAGRLESMPPWQCGGGMIASVTLDRTTFADPPARFEAGTPNIAGAVGLRAAIDYLCALGMERVAAYEQELLAHAVHVLEGVDGVRLLGSPRERTGILSFTVNGIHPHDISHFLDEEGIAVRAGHHCAQPLMERLGVPATVRVSLAFYNTKGELDALAPALEKANKAFR